MREAKPEAWDRVLRLSQACPPETLIELCEAAMVVPTIPSGLAAQPAPEGARTTAPAAATSGPSPARAEQGWAVRAADARCDGESERDAGAAAAGRSAWARRPSGARPSHQCMAAEPGAWLALAMLARHTAGGGAGSIMAASARSMIHSATAGGTSVCDVPFIHRATMMRSHSSCAAKVEAVQPSWSMQSRRCRGSMADADARQGRAGRVRNC